jgi:hypothetical protein
MLSHRIGGIPPAELVKERVNAIALAPVDEVRGDSDLFGDGVGHPDAQARIHVAFDRGLQTPDAELDLGHVLP